MQPNIMTIERNVQKVMAEFSTYPDSINVPEEIIKENITREIVEFLKPLIEYDFCDNSFGGKTYKGTLYVITGEKRTEQ